MSKAQDNLAAAFAGEAQANRKYLAFAKKAEEEGKPEIAKLFRAAAEGETVHAHNHLRNLGGVKTTTENLQEAIKGETYEFEKMYPEFIAGAQAENEKGAEMSFEGAKKVEEIHQKMFEKALEKLNAGEEILDLDYYICPVCGYPAAAHAPEKCPICATPGEKFYKA
jgi:rubrerythrin